MFHFNTAKRTCRRAVSVLTAALLLSSGMAVTADEIVIDNGSDSEEILIPDTEVPADVSGDALIVDSGNKSDEAVGLTIDELEADPSPETELIEIELIPAEAERISAHLEALLKNADPTGSNE